MFSKELEEVIEAALADGTITDKERAVLHKRAAAEGVDPDELDVVIDGRLAKTKKQEDWLKPTPPSTLMSNKVGNVMKCPNCGAPYQPGTVKCAECGHVFQNMQVVYSSVKMTDGINQIMEKWADKIESATKEGVKEENVSRLSWEKDDEVSEYIKNFPIPSSKDDLLEFITTMAGRRHSGSNEEEYNAKLKEAINKARTFFPDDPQLEPLIKRFTKLSWENLSTGQKILIGCILAMVSLSTNRFGIVSYE